MSAVPTPRPPAPSPRKWTKREYYRMGELGFFQGRRVELIAGEIIEMSPIGPLQSSVLAHVYRVLAKLIPDHHVRAQLPFDAADDAEPEPDLCVVAGAPLDYVEGHPKRAALIVEVADWSLAYDRGVKASRYAASGVADYWVINLPARQIEVFRDPRPDPAQPFGAGYASHVIVGLDGVLSPLAAPNVTISVRELLPPMPTKSE